MYSLHTKINATLMIFCHSFWEKRQLSIHDIDSLDTLLEVDLVTAMPVQLYALPIPAMLGVHDWLQPPDNIWPCSCVQGESMIHLQQNLEHGNNSNTLCTCLFVGTVCSVWTSHSGNNENLNQKSTLHSSSTTVWDQGVRQVKLSWADWMWMYLIKCVELWYVSLHMNFIEKYLLKSVSKLSFLCHSFSNSFCCDFQ